MNDGKIEQIDKPAEIFNRPKNELLNLSEIITYQLSGKKFAVRMDKTIFEIAKPNLRQRLSQQSISR